MPRGFLGVSFRVLGGLPSARLRGLEGLVLGGVCAGFGMRI